MAVASIMVGLKFGLLSVAEEMPRVYGRRRFLCKCDCGKSSVVTASNLRTGNTRSCGCVRDAKTKDRLVTHGMAIGKTSEYRAWTNMMARVSATGGQCYKDYVCRGIKVCERWKDPRNFIADMGKRPSHRHSLDRIDNDGNYEPGNCRWVVKSTQMHNTRELMSTNTSGFRGVSWSKIKKKWVARICNKGRQIALGTFDTAAEAAQVYQRALGQIREQERTASLSVRMG